MATSPLWPTTLSAQMDWLFPDESVLYIDDSHHQHIRAFDVQADGSLANGRLFADLSHDPGVPDGLKVDQQGNVHTTNALGIWTHDAQGQFLGLIETPEIPPTVPGAKTDTLLSPPARPYTPRTACAGRARAYPSIPTRVPGPSGVLLSATTPRYCLYMLPLKRHSDARTRYFTQEGLP